MALASTYRRHAFSARARYGMSLEREIKGLFDIDLGQLDSCFWCLTGVMAVVVTCRRLAPPPCKWSISAALWTIAPPSTDHGVWSDCVCTEYLAQRQSLVRCSKAAYQ